MHKMEGEQTKKECQQPDQYWYRYPVTLDQHCLLQSEIKCTCAMKYKQQQ